MEKPKIQTSRDMKNAPVVWAGGNPRTGQRNTFILYDNIKKTRHVLDLHTKEQHQRDQVTFAPDGDADRLNPEQQLGRQLHVNDAIQRLRRMNKKLIFEVSIRMPERMNIYVEVRGSDLRTGLPGMFKQQVSAMENGEMPEFSVMAPRMEERPTEDGQMKSAMKHAFESKRGWRTVLAKLLAANLITEPQIEKEFHVSEGRSSELWQKQIHSPITVGG